MRAGSQRRGLAAQRMRPCGSSRVEAQLQACVTQSAADSHLSGLGAALWARAHQSWWLARSCVQVCIRRGVLAGAHILCRQGGQPRPERSCPGPRVAAAGQQGHQCGPKRR